MRKKAQEKEQIVKKKSITWFALLGAVGFGLGAIIGWILGSIFLNFFTYFVVIFISGLLGGACLGYKLGDKSKAKTLSLVSGFSLLITYIVLLIVSNEFLGYILREVIIYSMIGGVCGALIGLTFRNKRVAAPILALFGVIGFGIGEYFGSVVMEQIIIKFGPTFYQDYPTGGVVKLLILMSIGGASLGAALGYLENKKHSIKN